MKKIAGLLILVMALCQIFSSNLYVEDTYPVTWLSEDYRRVDPFFEGLARVEKTINNKTKWGFIDKSGKEIIPAIYESAGFFSEGLAAVGKDGKFGFVDKIGKVIAPCVYDDAEDSFRNGFVTVAKGLG